MEMDKLKMNHPTKSNGATVFYRRNGKRAGTASCVVCFFGQLTGNILYICM